jgi:hypothetical protein
MNVKAVLFIFIFIPILAIGQIKSSIALMGGMDYTYRFLNNPPLDFELGTYNLTSGLNVERQFSKNYWVQIGVRYSTLGTQIKHVNLTWPSEYEGGGGYKFDPTLPHKLQLIINHSFIELPIGLKYAFDKKSKLTPYLLTSFSPNIYLSTKTTQITEFTTKIFTEKSPQIHKITLSINIGFGTDYSIGKNYMLFAQSSFHYHFTKLTDGPIGEYLYSYGMELGIRYGFK